MSAVVNLPTIGAWLERAVRPRPRRDAMLSSMNLDVLWHDLECGDYAEDLPLWRALADEAGGSVLDIGAGTGRVTLDLAAGGVPVVALDADASLLEALAQRGAARARRDRRRGRT